MDAWILGSGITGGGELSNIVVSVPKPEQPKPHTVKITVGAGEPEAIESAEAPAA